MCYAGGMEGHRTQFTGTIDFQQGTVTDDDSGEVFNMREWEDHVDDRIIEEYRPFMEERDLRAFDQNLPGEKPYFIDDWFDEFPSRCHNREQYPYDLGFRSPYESGGPAPEL